MVQEQQIKDGKAKLEFQGCIHHIKMQWVLMKKQLNSSGNVPRIFVIVCSSRDPERLGGEEHPTREFRGPDHLHVNVQ